MPAGLQVFDENGKVVLNLADRAARVISSFNVPGWTGTSRTLTHQIPQSVLNQGTPFVFYNRSLSSPTQGYWTQNYTFDVKVNGSGLITVSMSFAVSTQMYSFAVFYGVY